MNKKIILLLTLIVCTIFLFGCTQPNNNNNNSNPTKLQNFSTMGATICKENEKPIIRMYGTTWCPHCQWIKKTFDETVKKYVDENKIVAYHWELDIKDNLLTPTLEGNVPKLEASVFKQFNPGGGVPAFVFGCKYVRIGNGFEKDKTDAELALEKKEFIEMIEKTIKEA